MKPSEANPVPWNVLLVTVVVFFSIACMPESHSEEETIPPIKQAGDGIPDSNVQCAGGFVLIFKAEDLTPACVSHKGISLLASRGWALDLHPAPSKGPGNLTARVYNLAFLANYANPNYNSTLNAISKHLKGGDYLFVEGVRGSQVREKMQEIRSDVKNGVNVEGIIIYNSIQALTSGLQELPSGYNYIGYDYEKGSGFSPEFTTNESISTGYFDKAREAVEKYNTKTGSDAKLLIMPPYGELRTANWNWGVAARHADAIDIQLQAFIKNPRFLNYTLDAVGQIRQQSPTTKTFVQMSLVESRGTAMENMDAINTIRILPIDAFFMFYHPNQTSEVDQFLRLLP
ncbi:MAG TPA: hypothetical protein VJ792_04180 [Candidatus Nitrosotalea sp.]|nr:hypothetical protein [Candidatus Nitrosotalea sp.]